MKFIVYMVIFQVTLHCLSKTKLAGLNMSFDVTQDSGYAGWILASLLLLLHEIRAGGAISMESNRGMLANQ